MKRKPAPIGFYPGPLSTCGPGFLAFYMYDLGVPHHLIHVDLNLVLIVIPAHAGCNGRSPGSSLWGLSGLGFRVQVQPSLRWADVIAPMLPLNSACR